MKLILFSLPKVFLLAGLGLLASCDKEEDTNGNLNVETQGTALAAANNRQGKVAINDFRINIREVEFEYDRSDSRSTTEVEIKDVKLKGPFELDLLNTNTSLGGLLATVTLPNAVYEEVEFKMHKSTTSGPMLGKSILMTGTINGKPFILWHDTDEEFEIDFEDKNKDILINGQDQRLKIEFDLNTLFHAVSGVDLTIARDDDNDGTIEISPNDNDGNRELAKQVKDRLEAATDLIDN